MRQYSSVKIVARLVVFLILVLALCPASVLLIRVSNDIKLVIFAHQLRDLPLPDGAVVVGRNQRIFDQGNGMYCGFEASIDIQSPLTTKEDWRMFFAKQPEEQTMFYGPIFSWAAKERTASDWRFLTDAESKAADKGVLRFVIYSLGHETFDTRC